MNLSDPPPPDVREHYKLDEKSTPDGRVYVAVKRGMYGLPQAGILAQEQLKERLNKHGYEQSTFTPGFWTHKWRPISFSLVLDNFGIKYVGKEHANHLISVIANDYDYTVDWDGKQYLGLALDWDYAKRLVHLSMPEYIPDTLTCFNHEHPTRVQYSPYQHTPIMYGAAVQFAKDKD